MLINPFVYSTQCNLLPILLLRLFIHILRDGAAFCVNVFLIFGNKQGWISTLLGKISRSEPQDTRALGFFDSCFPVYALWIRRCHKVFHLMISQPCEHALKSTSNQAPLAFFPNITTKYSQLSSHLEGNCHRRGVDHLRCTYFPTISRNQTGVTGANWMHKTKSLCPVCASKDSHSLMTARCGVFIDSPLSSWPWWSCQQKMLSTTVTSAHGAETQEGNNGHKTKQKHTLCLVVPTPAVIKH